MGSKGAIGGPLGDKLNLTLGISELHLKSKKILHVLNGSFYTQTRYFKVFDEERKKRSQVFSKRRFLNNLVEGGHSFFKFFKGGYLKKLQETMI